jgi:hypothetical protein
MKQPILAPCSRWAEKLAATHPNDLAPSEREALQAHIASCPICASIRAEYEAMGTYLGQLPTIAPRPGLPPALLHLWHKQEDAQILSPSTQDDAQIEFVPLPQTSTFSHLLSHPVRRMRRMRTFLQTLAAVLVVGALLGGFVALFASHHTGPANPGPQPGNVSGAWHLIPGPDPSTSSALIDVSALSAKDAWAVGFYPHNIPITTAQTLIEHWNGTNWSIVPSPNTKFAGNVLSGVVAISSSDVWAVGNSSNDASVNASRTLIEHWDGFRWRIVPSPNVVSSGNLLGRVAAVSADDIWTVGYSITNDGRHQSTLIEHWNGQQWSIVPGQNPGLSINKLNDISAVSANDVWAVGISSDGNSPTLGQVLIEHWNGRQWSVVKNSDVKSSDNFLTSVTAVSATDIWAVGTSSNSISTNAGQTLIEHWNGTQWSVVSSPNVDGKGNVVGSLVNSMAPVPTAGSVGDMLASISAISANDIWAIGTSFTNINPNNGTEKSFTLHWNGQQWSVIKSPNPGSDTTMLISVAYIPGTSHTWTVGYYSNDSSKGFHTLTALYS